MNFGQGKIGGSIDWFTQQTKDFIDLYSSFSGRYENKYVLNASGVEVRLDGVLRESEDFKWVTGVSLSTYRSEFAEIPDGYQLANAPGGFFQNPFVVLEDGQPLGTIYAPLYTGNVDANGFPIFADIDEDGMVNAFGSSFDPEGDFANVGSGIPNFELGWNTHLQYRGWEMLAFFRGAFGHVLVNRQRQFQEPIPERRLLSNVGPTALADPKIRATAYSSLYVEPADFFKLDNLTLAKTFTFSTSRRPCQLRVSLTGQNLLVITDYAGSDPEPALADPGEDFFTSAAEFSPLTSPFAVGIDRRDSYLPSKTIVLGVGLEF